MTTANNAAPGPVPHLKRASVRIFPVFCMIYIFASAGAFSIEDMVSASGPGLTILLLVLLPIFWSLPMALIACELGSALPGEGGFYTWVRRALGDFWGFQGGWWWSLSVFVDSSVYVVLTATYLQSWFGFDQLSYYLVCWSLIAVFAVMNIIGVSLVAASTTIFTLIVVVPFVALSVVGIAQWQHNPFTPLAVPGAPLVGADGVLAIGLAIGVWMYSGYESISTLSGEIRNPQKIIPRALLLALPFIAAMYLLPTIASLAAYGHWESFGVTASEDTVTFVEIGRALGGPLLGLAMLAAALVSNISAYLDYLAAGARPLFAFSEDGLFPKSISRISPRFGTPIGAILLMAGINAVLVIGPFQNLVVIDVMLLISAYLLIFIAAVRLRIKEPQLKRRFRVPLGTVGMAAMIVPPILIVVFTMYITAIDQSTELFGATGISLPGIDIGWYGMAGLAALLSGPLVYAIFRRIYGGPTTPSSEAGNEAIALAEAETSAEAGV